MSNEEILQGNRLIAQFMGDVISKDGKGIVAVTGAFGIGTKTVHPFEYRSSWDWLMPAIEKIQDLKYGTQINRGQFQIYSDLSCIELIIDADFYKTRIENAWDGVIAFIKWYPQRIYDLQHMQRTRSQNNELERLNNEFLNREGMPFPMKID